MEKKKIGLCTVEVGVGLVVVTGSSLGYEYWSLLCGKLTFQFE